MSGPALTTQDHTWLDRWALVVQRLTLVEGEQQRLELTQRLLDQAPRPVVLAFVNAHGMNLAADMPGFAADLIAADVLVRDGSGMRGFLTAQGLPAGLNMNGTDYIPELLQACGRRRVALWGTEAPYLQQAQAHLTARGWGTCVSCLDGFQPLSVYLDAWRQTQPEVVILGMGMPKQEAVAQAVKANATGPCLLVCGGAILDFLGGKVSRAPAIYRQLGLEWLYRLAVEPRRLFRRYLVGNPLFLWRTLQFKLWSGRPGAFKD